MAETFYEEVCTKAFALRDRMGFPPLTDSDVGSIEREVRLLEARGATVEEAVKYIKCCEEYNPELDEATALRRMHEIKEQVEKRTGKPWYGIKSPSI